MKLPLDKPKKTIRYLPDPNAPGMNIPNFNDLREDEFPNFSQPSYIANKINHFCEKHEFNNVNEPIKHIDEIVRCLNKEFSITDVIKAGSIFGGTAVNGYSDWDYMLCFKEDQVPNDSYRFIKYLFKLLKNEFGEKVSFEPQAISFHTSAYSIDIVPVFNINEKTPNTNEPLETLLFPRIDGDWDVTHPRDRIAKLNSLNRKHDGRLFPLIRLLKIWKYNNHIPIISYYLESFMLHLAINSSFSCNPHLDIAKIFYSMLGIFHRTNVSIVDPNQFSYSTRIVPCKKEEFISVLEATKKSFIFLTKAIDVELTGYSHGALSFWNLFFKEEIF